MSILQCSKSCGQGQQFRSVHCQLKSMVKRQALNNNQSKYSNTVIVPAYHCGNIVKPAVIRSCSLGDCGNKYSWRFESRWSEVSNGFFNTV